MLPMDIEVKVGLVNVMGGGGVGGSLEKVRKF